MNLNHSQIRYAKDSGHIVDIGRVSEAHVPKYTLNSRYILVLTTLYVVIGLAAIAMSFRFVKISYMVVSGATLIFGLNFYILDIVTEVYGYSVSRKLIWLGFLSEFVFLLLINLINFLPYPSFFQLTDAYHSVFDHLFKFVTSAFIADFAGMFTASYLMSKWKVISGGRYFWLRSFFTTAVADLIMTCIIGIGAFSGSVSNKSLLVILGSGYLIHLAYAAILIWPAFIFAIFLKKNEGIDVFDVDLNYNPFKILNE